MFYCAIWNGTTVEHTVKCIEANFETLITVDNHALRRQSEQNSWFLFRFECFFARRHKKLKILNVIFNDFSKSLFIKVYYTLAVSKCESPLPGRKFVRGIVVVRTDGKDVRKNASWRSWSIFLFADQLFTPWDNSSIYLISKTETTK